MNRQHSKGHALAPFVGLLLLFFLFGAFFACSPPDGTRRPQIAYHESGPPPLMSYEGEEVFWEGDWRKDGEATFYDDTGHVTGQGQYDLGLETGAWILINNGRRGEGSFSEGQRSGPWIYSYPSGKTEESGSYVDGKRHGEWQMFYTNGAKKSTTTYEQGEKVGPVISWDKDGGRL